MTDMTPPVGVAAVPSDDRRFPTMPQTGNPVPARPSFSRRHQRNAAIIGGATAAVVAISNGYLLTGAWFQGSGWLPAVAFMVSVVGVPIAIATLIVCGTQSRRYRSLLVIAGLVLLASPFIGVLIGAAAAGQPPFDLR